MVKIVTTLIQKTTKNLFKTEYHLINKSLDLG